MVPLSSTTIRSCLPVPSNVPICPTPRKLVRATLKEMSPEAPFYTTGFSGFLC
jgi:hypothetical protein